MAPVAPLNRTWWVPPRLVVGLALVGAASAALPAALGDFISDDYWNLAEARAFGWGWDLLGRSVFGHVTPATGAASWLVAGPGGGRYGAAVLQLAVLGAALPVAALLAARGMGAARRPAAVAALATTASVGWASASTWWSAGLNLYPSAIAGLLVLVAVCAAVRGAPWGPPFGAIALSIGLAFSDGAIVFLVLPCFVVVQAARSRAGGGRAWLRERRAAWAVLASPVLVLLAVRASASEPVESYAHPSLVQAATFPFAFVVRAWLPGVVGLAPGRFELAGSPLATALVAVAAVAVAGVLLRRRLTAGTWWLLAGALATVLARGAMVAWGRLELLGWDRAFELRYVADLCWMVPVVVAAGLRPAEVSDEIFDGPVRPPRAQVPIVIAAVVIVLGFVGQVVVAAQAPAGAARGYRQRLASSAAALPPSASVLDATVPAQMIGPEFGPFTFLSVTLAPTGVDLPFGTTAPFFVPDGRGRLHEVELGAVSRLLVDEAFTAAGAPGVAHERGCWVAGTEGALVWVPLTVEVLRYWWTLDLRGTGGSTTDIGIVAAGRSPVASVGPSPAGRGRDRWLVATTGFAGTQVGFQLGPHQRLCLASGSVSQAVSAT